MAGKAGAKEYEELKRRVDEMELRSKRPAASTAEYAGELPEIRKAMSEYMRRGREVSEASRQVLNTVNTAILGRSKVGNSEDAGFAVAPELYPGVVERLTVADKMKMLANTITTSSSSVEITVEKAGFTDDDWTTEGSAAPTGKNGLRKVKIPVNNLRKKVPVSQELVDDATFDIIQYTTSRLNRTFDRAEARAFAVGDGVNKPLGLTSAITAANSNLVDGGTMTNFDKVITLQSTLTDGYDSQAMFFMNRTTLGKLKSLKGSDGHYIWKDTAAKGMPSSMVSGFLEDKEVVIIDTLPTIASGTVGILYGDMKSYYTIANREAMTVNVNIYDGMNTNDVNVYGTRRVGGAPVLPEAMVGLKGTIS